MNFERDLFVPFQERNNALQPQTSSDHQGRRYTRPEPCHAPIKRCYGHLTILAATAALAVPYGFFSLAASAAY